MVSLDRPSAVCNLMVPPAVHAGGAAEPAPAAACNAPRNPSTPLITTLQIYVSKLVRHGALTAAPHSMLPRHTQRMPYAASKTRRVFYLALHTKSQLAFMTL